MIVTVLLSLFFAVSCVYFATRPPVSAEQMKFKDPHADPVSAFISGLLAVVFGLITLVNWLWL